MGLYLGVFLFICYLPKKQGTSLDQRCLKPVFKLGPGVPVMRTNPKGLPEPEAQHVEHARRPTFGAPPMQFPTPHVRVTIVVDRTSHHIHKFENQSSKERFNPKTPVPCTATKSQPPFFSFFQFSPAGPSAPTIAPNTESLCV